MLCQLYASGKHTADGTFSTGKYGVGLKACQLYAFKQDSKAEFRVISSQRGSVDICDWQFGLADDSGSIQVIEHTVRAGNSSSRGFIVKMDLPEKGVMQAVERFKGYLAGALVWDCSVSLNMTATPGCSPQVLLTADGPSSSTMDSSQTERLANALTCNTSSFHESDDGEISCIAGEMNSFVVTQEFC